jgi:hypothetical protein
VTRQRAGRPKKEGSAGCVAHPVLYTIQRVSGAVLPEVKRTEALSAHPPSSSAEVKNVDLYKCSLLIYKDTELICARFSMYLFRGV